MRPFIALTPAGFYVRGRMGFRARLIAWHSIERVKAQFRQLDIIGLNQSLFPVARYAADDTDQAQAILNEIESAYLRHLDAQEMPELCPR
jgi:hypothetical protein